MTCTYKFNTKDGEVKLVGQPAMKAWLAVNGIDAIIAPKGGKYGANTQLVEGQVGPRFSIMDDGAQSVTDTPAFKHWFGDSKVVDADGKPLVVYHGTNRNISEFNTDPENTVERKRIGAYFTANPRFAGMYGDNVMSVYLSIKNPLDITGMDAKEAIDALPVSERLKKEMRAAFRGSEYSQYGLIETAQRDGVRQALEADGYDGVKYTEGYADAFIVFHPEQIKSATGNNGDFDGSNPDIRYSVNDDYRDEHRAPGREDGAPLSDLTGDGNIYPDDVYSANGPRYYGTGVSYDREAFQMANRLRGKPDAEVTIYRAVPSNIDAEINDGDWVAITKQYAIDHGESRFDGDYKIISKKVRAGDIFTNGDSIQEWGYNPEGAEKYSTDNAKTLADVRSAWDAAGIKNFISERNGTINLSQIVVPESGRNSGAGTKAMQQLIDYADATGQRITLSPSADFGGSKSRLTAFYKRFGFVENKGRNKDYAISETMYREPQGQVASSQRYSIDNGKAQAEFGPVHTEFRDDAAGAVKQLMADKNGEAIVHRDDVGDISLVYGDGKMGLSHIVNRRGAGFVDRIPELLRDGTLYSKPGQKDRVFIGTDRDEAVLRFEWDGKAKTWLLSAYEKYPDLKTASDVRESRRSHVVDERSTAPLTKDTLRQAVTRGVLGSVVNSMIDAGVVVLHDTTKSLPIGSGRNIKGVQAVTTPDGKIHLVASNLTAKNANAVMLHEAFHQGAEKLLGNEQWGELMGRLGSLYRQGEQSSGKAKDFFDKARQRVAAAKAKGGVSAKMELEEFAAYAIEEYESAPASVKKWVDDLLGMIKAWLAKRFGKQFGDVTPAQLSAFAKWAVMDSAVQRRGDIFGDIGNLFSMAGSITDTPAFKRWFGDSKVVNGSGAPLVMYHGTTQDFSEFQENRRGVLFVSPSAKWVSEFKWTGSEQGNSTEGSNVMPVYVKSTNPFDYENKKHVNTVAAHASLGSSAISQIRKGSWQRLEDRTLLATIKKLGFDGLYVNEDGVKNLAVFRPDQIKSAIGNNGDFDPSNPDIRFSVNNGVPKTGKQVTLHYLRNTESAAKNSASFSDVGQGIEPAGEYMNVDQDAPLSAPSDKWESGTITFSNPLVLEHKSTDSNGWKKDLSDMFGGKTGAALSKAVKSAGYDGIITYDKYGLSETVNLSGDKQQGAMPRFSLADDTRTTTAPAAPQEPNRYTPPEQGPARRLQAVVQDNMNRVTQVQDKIKELTGRTTLGKADYRAAEVNRPGRIAARLEDAQDKLTGPLMKKLAKYGKTPEQLSELLHAQHAQERNEAVARINPEMPDGGSGMTTAEANKIIERYKDAEPLQELAAKAREIAKATLDLKLAYGLIKPADHEMLATMYQNYVPLKGDGEYGPKIKRAMGHDERDEHILENIARDYEQAVVTGEKNLARQSLLQMVLKFPDSELWNVGMPPRGRYVAGKVYSVQDSNGKEVGRFTSQSQVTAFLEGKGAAASRYSVYDSAGERVTEFTKPLQDNEVMVYVNGDPVRIQIHDEKLATQLRPLNQAQMGPILEQFRKVNRYLSSIYTGYNPAFILRNATRDAITGTINMLGNEGAAVAAKAWGKYPVAVAALGQWATTKKAPDTKAGRYLTEYRMHGGKTGASYMSDLEQQGENLQFMYDKTRGLVATAKEGNVKRTAAVAWNKTVGRLAHVVEIANQATENGLRLGLYMALREEGVSADKAAQAAKSVTVDFDRKGSSTGALGAIYLFFNPAVQGTANAMKTLMHGQHKGQAWAALGGLVAAGFLAASKGMDEDKDKWLGEGWETRTKNLIINTPGHQFRAPMSQEFAPAYAFGVAMAEAARGESKVRTAARIVSSFIDAYFPLQGAYKEDSDNHLADAAQAATPTVLKPLIESAMNRNSFGSQVVPESELTKDKPDNLKMNRGTKNTAYDKAAQGIAAAGESIFGVGKYENDITKVSPETLKSLWRTYTGGLGQFITDSAGVAAMGGRDPSQIEASDVPIIKDFYRPSTVGPIRSRYYDLSKEAKAAITEFEQAKKVGDGAELSNIIGGEKGKLVGLGKMVRSVSKAAAALGDEKVAVNASTTLNDSEKRAELKRIEKEEEELYRSGIEAFK